MFTNNLGLQTNQLPYFGIIGMRAIENCKRRIILVGVMSDVGKIESAKPCPGVLFSSFGRIFFNGCEDRFGLRVLPFTSQYTGEIVLGNRVVGVLVKH